MDYIGATVSYVWKTYNIRRIKNEGYEVSLHVKIELFVDFSFLIFRRRLAYLKESLS